MGRGPDDRGLTGDDIARLAVPVDVPPGAGVVAEIIRALDAGGVTVADLSFRQPSLDDVFLALTGRGTEEADAVSEGQSR